MGKIPIVLIIKIAINQPFWLFLADFRRAMLFHTVSQSTRGTIINGNHKKSLDSWLNITADSLVLCKHNVKIRG